MADWESELFTIGLVVTLTLTKALVISVQVPICRPTIWSFGATLLSVRSKEDAAAVRPMISVVFGSRKPYKSTLSFP